MRSTENKFIRYISTHTEYVWIWLSITISGVAHMVNMFKFPALWDDEGFYVSQARAIVNTGNLSYYTYIYDHTPVGWLFISAWNILTGNLIHIGSAIQTDRIFIAILNLFTVYFLFKIVQYISGKSYVAALSTLFYSLSPLAIFFHRQVFLDNIMVFWLMWSIWQMVRGSKLSRSILSSIFFAIAVLTKEQAIVFLPIMLVGTAMGSNKRNRFFYISIWIAIFSLLVTLYPILALIKGEFFPAGTLLGGDRPHVSLISQWQFQTGRSGKPFYAQDSDFQKALYESWLNLDTYFVILGMAMTVLNVIWVRTRRWMGFISAMSLFYVAYLLKSIALDYYIIPLVPLFSASIALGLDELYRRLKRIKILSYGKIYRYIASAVVTVIILGVMFQLRQSAFVFTQDQTSNQLEAIQWLKQNVNNKSTVVADMSVFADANDGISDISQTKLHTFWKLKDDAQIRDGVFKNNWQNIDYLVVNSAFKANTKEGNIGSEGIGIGDDAYKNSRVIKTFNNNQFVSKSRYANGLVEIREVNNHDLTLKSSWEYYRQNFITNDGRVVDPANNLTTTEGQSYALLRAVWQDDQTTFDKVLGWTQKYLQHSGDKLFSWVYGEDENKNLVVLDSNNATDGDIDTSFALAMAHKLWGQERYLQLAEGIIKDIYSTSVVGIGDLDYLRSSQKLEKDNKYLINPSYFSPAQYRIFDQIDNDPTHNWEKLAADSYKILNKIPTTEAFKDTKLPPNWFLVDKITGELSSAKSIVSKSDDYSYDAFRIFWRLALDNSWNEREEAKTYLNSFQYFFEQEWKNNRSSFAVYNINGQPKVNYGNPSVDTGIISVFLTSKSDFAGEVYLKDFKYTMDEKQQYWGEKNNYYDQNWGWFATALYSNQLKNFWSK
jgi:endo-1,4-beta-D-glucanase Y